MNVGYRNISSLSGIEHFIALTGLSCDDNQLTELDLSKNKALTWLYCSYNQLTELDLSNNTALLWLDCNDNKLTKLDLTQNTALQYIYCYNNQLTELDVTQNTALEYLICYNNQLTELDLSNSTALRDLRCYNNQLTKLDLSNSTALIWLYCSYNQLTELDLSNNTVLLMLYCHNNQLTKLDVTQNTALGYLYCYNNQLTELDVTQNTLLLYPFFQCENNPLTRLRLSGNREMNIRVEPEGSGTVMLTAFNISTLSASLRAMVNGGGTFNGWAYAGFSSNPSSSSNPVSFTLPDNPVVITANFGGAITGTVEIDGTAKFGQTLTANVAGSNATAFAYQWKRGMVDIDGANTASYVLEEADIGETITVAVTAPGFSGELVSAPTDAVAKADGPAAPAAPTMAGRTATSITLNTIACAEYRQGASGMWQDSAEFIGLAPNTVYTFYARIAETSTHLASEASEASAGIATERSVLFGDFTGNGTVDANDILWIQRYIISGRDLSIMAQAFSPETIDAFNELAADFTNTGYVDANDILWIRRYIVSNRDADIMIEEFTPSIDFSHLKG